MQLEYEDHRRDPGRWARSLRVSREAIDLYLASDVIDLHIDSFIWTRVFGYDLTKRHGQGPLGARFFSQLDLPRLREAQIKGGIWAVTTNPFRTARGRSETFRKNLTRLREILEGCANDVAIVRTRADYEQAKQAGKHAAWIGIQGGNALDHDEAALDLAGDLVIRVTVVHLSTSSLGQTSAPSPGRRQAERDAGLSRAGKNFVARLNEKRIFVDLAHVSRRGFFDAVDAHDRSQPLIVTHTGVAGVHKHWRNLDDDQLRAVAKTGGTVGVMYQSSFLGEPFLGGRAEAIVRHLEHIVNVAGEDCGSLGSDWDGMICPPRDMPTCLELPRLVEGMLARRFSAEQIQKILGGNYLRALERLRG